MLRTAKDFKQANWHPGHSQAGYFFFAGFLAAAAFFGAAFFAVAIMDHLISVCGVSKQWHPLDAFALRPGGVGKVKPKR